MIVFMLMARHSFVLRMRAMEGFFSDRAFLSRFRLSLAYAAIWRKVILHGQTKSRVYAAFALR